MVAELTTEEAVELAVEALFELQDFNVRIMVTARVEAETSVEAVDLAHAKELVAKLDPNDFNFSYDKDQGFDGDAIAYVSEDGDDEHEQDLYICEPGELMSWTACDIVAELAACGEDLDKLMQLVWRAREAFNVSDRPVRPV